MVAGFAAKAGVDERVKPLLCDALAVTGESCFDAVVAIDSSSSFPRPPWFDRTARLLRRGGRVFVYDCFLQSREFEAPFNHHWCAQIGTAQEYISAARAAGLRTEAITDVSSRAVHFWTTTLALMRAEVRERTLAEAAHAHFNKSLRIHELVRRGILDGGLSHLLMSFVKD
jgi:tocopherol O-methyltransferase